MLETILAIVFVILAAFLLAAPERHFRGGTRRLRVVGAAAFLVGAAVLATSLVRG